MKHQTCTSYLRFSGGKDLVCGFLDYDAVEELTTSIFYSEHGTKVPPKQ
jgi:hypothetical protein